MDNSFSEENFTWEIVPNDGISKAQKEELIYAKDGILDQIKLPYPLGTKPTVFMPYEVGEYSIYLHENLDGLYQIGIFTDDNRVYRSKEILASSEGSIVYFNEKLEGINAGFIYRGWENRYNPFYIDDPDKIALELFKAGQISATTYLNIVSKRNT